MVVVVLLLGKNSEKKFQLQLRLNLNAGDSEVFALDMHYGRNLGTTCATLAGTQVYEKNPDRTFLPGHSKGFTSR